MWMGGLGAAALAVVVAVVVFSTFSSGSGSSASGGGNRADGVVENFSFTLFQGEETLGAEKLDIHQILGKPIVLNFWAGQCPPCRAEMPDLQEFYESSKDEVTLLGIDVGQFTGLGNRRNAASLLKELDITYPAGYTGDASVVRKYRVLGMPTTVFINPDGTIFETWSGILNVDILNRLTGAMINQAAREQVPS
jgi:thiol-disulfide isomerase/thioredoxin